ncbi:MAG: MBL fold metallo-hydrolase [Candidatus Aminicenantes bacterium]|nr:MBL fold metallo-hydrolase [Candidatus Aminicenantes bacterium]
MMKKLSLVAALTLALSFAGHPAFAQQTQPAAKPAMPEMAAMTVQQIAPALYLVKGGSGANTAFYVANKFVMAIDAKMSADAARQMIAAIAKTTPNPIQTLILTHSDQDHVNGLNGFPAGLTILSSEGTKREMEEAFRDEKMAALRAYLPTQTYKSSYDLNGDLPGGKKFKISLFHFGPAHTSGDTIILFRDEKVAFVGDLAFTGRDPLIHRQKGGTSIGYIATLKKMIDLPADSYLSGHADPLTKDDLRALLKSMEEKLTKVKELVGQGKTLDEVKTAMGVQTQAGSRWPSLVEVMYLDLTEKR